MIDLRQYQTVKVQKGMDEETYHLTPELGSTDIKNLCDSVACFETPFEMSEQLRQSMAFGTAFHLLMSDLRAFYKQYFVGHEVPLNKDGSLSKRSKEFKQAVIDHPNVDILSPVQFESLLKMHQAVINHKVSRITKLYEKGEYETSIFTEDPGTGIRIKGRFDFLNKEKGVFVDFKTTRDPSPRGIKGTIYRLQYHVQAACYKAILDKEIGGDFRCIFAFVGSKPPHLCNYVEITGELLQEGFEKRRAALNRLDQYQREDDPIIKEELYGYPQELMVLE